MSEPALHLKIVVYAEAASISQEEAEACIRYLYKMGFIKTDNVSVEVEEG